MNPYPALPPPSPDRTVRRRIAVAIVVAVALVAGGFGAGPAYRQFKRWRTGRLVAESARLLERNELSQAQTKAQAALLLTPGDPPALRALATALTRATNVQALQFWAQLLQTGRASELDRRGFVEQALRAGAAGVAAQELEKLLAEAPDQSVNLWLASQLFVLLNDRSQTVQYATQAAARDPTNRQYNLFLSSLRFDAPESALRDRARSDLWERAEDPGPLGLQAQAFLAQRKDLTPEQRARLIILLRQHPLKTVTHELTALGLELDAAPGRRGELLDQALARYQNAPPAARIEFAVWLNQNGEFRRTLAALPLAQARTRKDFFLPHLDALASLRLWAELLELFETQPMPLEPVYAEAFRARCHAQLKNDSLASLHWRTAVHEAQRSPEQLMWLELYAEKCGEVDTAKKTLRSLIACLQNPRPAFQELERLTEQYGSTLELRDLLAEMVRRWPKEAALQNDHAYLNLLLSAEVPAARQTAEDLMKQSPESLPYRTTFALALCRQKDFAGALRAYDGREYDWSQALPSQRAVYAAVLAANGRADEARQLARGLPADRLRPEELALLRPRP